MIVINNPIDNLICFLPIRYGIIGIIKNTNQANLAGTLTTKIKSKKVNTASSGVAAMILFLSVI